VVLDLGGQGRRDRDDHMPRLDVDLVRLDLDRVVEASDPPHRRLEHDSRAEAVGQADGDQLGAARKPGLLGAAARRDEAQEAAGVALVAGRRDVEEYEQQRKVACLGAPVRLHGGVEGRLPAPRRQVRLLPGLERLGIPFVRARRLPGLVHGNLPRPRVEREESR
jgi:hypothetical protein